MISSTGVGLTDKEFFTILGMVLIVIQFLYRLWDRKDNKEVIQAISDGVISFNPHLKKAQEVQNLIEELYKMHNIRDNDGRYLWYIPKEHFELQRDLVKTNQLIALTQKQIVRLMEKIELKIEHHKEICTEQFNTLNKKMKE